MKRLTLILMAGLLMLGMTQCKKEQTNANANAEGEWVNITVKVDAGDRHIVYPGTGAVVYSNDDKIYVGNNGHYVGTLTYNNGAFTGQIQSPSTEDYLHFYFIGGEYTGTLTAGTTESFNWSIADQSEKLPVLSYGHSTQKYTDATATYGCTLENQCALVEFSLAIPAETVSVGDMLTEATVSFATPGITPTATTGSITLYSSSRSATKWAILLPKDSDTETTAIVGNASDAVTVPAIAANEYVHGDAAVAIDNPYVFSVSATTTVQFSPGNLRATTSDRGAHWTWSFAENQLDYIGDNPGNTTINGNGTVSSAGTVTVDMFGWSTAATYFGINNSTNNSTYSGDFVDWGTNAIYNPKTGSTDAANTWRTLTGGYSRNEEWEYLREHRNNASKLLGYATVAGVVGLIILPDNWDGDVVLNSNLSRYNDNVISDGWESDWESHGAVFLPIAGHRQGTVVRDVRTIGYYSSASPSGASDTYVFYFSDDEGVYVDEQFRYDGCCVRLVRDVR